MDRVFEVKFRVTIDDSAPEPLSREQLAHKLALGLLQIDPTIDRLVELRELEET